jgi:hypothetical protein
MYVIENIKIVHSMTQRTSLLSGSRSKIPVSPSGYSYILGKCLNRYRVKVLNNILKLSCYLQEITSHLLCE